MNQAGPLGFVRWHTRPLLKEGYFGYIRLSLLCLPSSVSQAYIKHLLYSRPDVRGQEQRMDGRNWEDGG